MVAREQKILPAKLSEMLQLKDDERLRAWTGSLLDKGILVTHGKTRGTAYLVNPKLIASVQQNIKPSLKTIEPHALKALIVEDLKLHPGSSTSEIQGRIPDVGIEEIRKIVYKRDGTFRAEGGKRHRVYFLANNK